MSLKKDNKHVLYPGEKCETESLQTFYTEDDNPNVYFDKEIIKNNEKISDITKFENK